MRTKILPPTYLLAALIAMAALHFLLPLAKMIATPYNYLGIAAIVAGVGISSWASCLFNRADTTVKPFEESRSLVTEGPYRVSRHPMYLGMAVALAGAAVVLGTVTPALVVVPYVLVTDRIFIVDEEKMMEETFGDAYRDYRKRVRRWL